MAMVQIFDLLFAVTTNVTGPSQSIQASNRKPAPQYQRPVEVMMSLDGQGAAAAVTIQIQTSIDNSAWVNWGQAFVLTSTGQMVGPQALQAGSPVMGAMGARFARAVSSGISGASPLVNVQIKVR